MATYAIGDIHGCMRTLERLLERIRFDDARDRLWLTGDLVNRGPASLAVVRWARERERSVTSVLGNHDVHLLACAEGLRALRAQDTLAEFLAAPDRAELLAWLRRRPLLLAAEKHSLVHAGLLAEWDLDAACAAARRLEEALAGARYASVLAEYFRRDGEPSPLRMMLRVFIALRTVDARGAPRAGFTGPLASLPPNEHPWFSLPHRRDPDWTVIFGHWAALDLYRAPGYWGLDTGCAWGRSLTALDVERGGVIQEPYADGAGR
ncbi:MAG: symmetrical bis(5'-nucleosyl)-tetraphosphatase [Planctomycetes bacterium]|nr:symmetrical bis(5'-nucleosyl)-tetraphosphatase [Planctomycetota bacterium]